MRKLTVLQSVPEWLPLTQSWLYNQTRFLPRDEIESHVVCEGTANLDQFPQANLHSILSNRSSYYWQRLKRKLLKQRQFDHWPASAKRFQVDLVHSHFGPTGWLDEAWASQMRLPHIVSFYGYDVGLIPRDGIWLERYQEMFASASAILCEGPYMANSIVQLGCPAEKVRVHRLGVMLDALPSKARSWHPGEPLRVLIAASFREKKGIPYALQALGRLASSVELEVTLIGDSDGSPASAQEKVRIMAAVAASGLKEVVELRGFRPYRELLEEAYSHHIYLAPSVTASDGDCEGGAPVALIEMLATGMPVVATRHCDIPQVVRDGLDGYLADERDVDGLVQAIKKLIAEPEQWSMMAASARAHLEDKFSVSHQARGLTEIYQSQVST